MLVNFIWFIRSDCKTLKGEKLLGGVKITSIFINVVWKKAIHSHYVGEFNIRKLTKSNDLSWLILLLIILETFYDKALKLGIICKRVDASGGTIWVQIQGINFISNQSPKHWLLAFLVGNQYGPVH